MLKLYFKQGWQILKQNRFYSSIYILATGVAIAMVMILAIVLYLQVANIYPETSRDRLLITEWAQTATEKGDKGTARISLEVVKQCFYPLKTTKAVTAVYGMWGGNFIQLDNSDEQLPAKVKYVDDGFWRVFNFSFIDGKPFTESDMQSGIRTAVICESLARQLFGTTDVTGKFISLNFEQYQLCGVVKDVSYITDHTFSQLWIPFSSYAQMIPAFNTQLYDHTLGTFMAFALAPSKADIKKVKQEIHENVSRFNASLGQGLDFSIYSQPDSQWQAIFRFSGNREPNFTQINWQYILIFLLFLLIPAISLSGMANSQMERRFSEMGIRRAFGATRGKLINHIVGENLLLTTIGGLFGLLLSYGLIYFFRRWIIHVVMAQKYLSEVPQGLDNLTTSMLINYPIFAIAIAVCLILNLMVTVIPAWQASGREIIYSIHNK